MQVKGVVLDFFAQTASVDKLPIVLIDNYS